MCDSDTYTVKLHSNGMKQTWNSCCFSSNVMPICT